MAWILQVHLNHQAHVVVQRDRAGQDTDHSDPDPTRFDDRCEEIDPAFIRHAQALLREAVEDDALIADWFARFMTQPKYAHLEDLTGERRTAMAGGVRYENGEPVDKAD